MHVGDPVQAEYMTPECGNDSRFPLTFFWFSLERERDDPKTHLTPMIIELINICDEQLQFGQLPRQIFASLIFPGSREPGVKEAS